MTRVLSTTICLLFISFFAAAQNVSVLHNLWTDFTPSREEFSVKAPCIFKSDDSKQDWNIYSCVSNDNYFFITSNSDEETSQYKVIKELTESISESKLIITGLEGTKSTFLDSEGFYHTVLSVRTNKRFYIFHSVSMDQTNPDADAFIKSIRIDRFLTTKRNSPSKPESIMSMITRPTIGKCEKFVMIECANVIRNPKERRVTDLKPDQNTPLKVLNTARPGYTGLAVLYSLEGTVRVRVTFLATGQVGSVSPVNKLPFGLTNNALKAARFIGFEPAVRDGVAVNVAKAVEFNFSIH